MVESTLQLRDALRSFLQESCEFLASQPSGSREWIRVVRDPSGGMSFPSERRLDFSEALLRLRLGDRLASSSAFGRLVEVIRRDARLTSVLLVDAGGKPVEGEKMQRWWLENMLAGPFVHRYVERIQGVGFDEQVFSIAFGEFQRDTESPDVTVTELSPLMNVDIEFDQIQTEPDIRIRQLSTDELEGWLNTEGIFPSHPLNSFELLQLQCAIEVVYQQSRGAASGPSPAAYEKVFRLMTAMRLLTNGSPRLAFTTRRSSTLHGGGHTTWGGSTPHFGPRVKIGTSQESALIDLCSRLRSSPNRDRAALALARWNTASDRLTQEDKLIDYWIGLESLFLPDITDELAYRAAIRIAIYLGSNDLERQRIFEDMRASYRRRSAIVHGSVSESKGRKTLATAEVSEVTRSYLRQVLLKILQSDKSFDPSELDAQLFA